MAEQKGFFKKHHLAAEHVLIGTSVGTAALVNEELDYLHAVAQTLSAAIRGLPVRLVLIIQDKPQYLVISKPEYRSLSDLKGKTIGTTSYGSTAHLMLQSLLLGQGLTPGRDVQIVASGNGQAQLAAMQAGRIEAMIWPPPIDVEARKLGYKVLLRMSDMLSVPVGGLGVTLEKIRRQRDQVKKVIMATLETAMYIKANREEVIGHLGKWLRTSPENAGSVYEHGLDWYSKSWGLDPGPLQVAIALEMERRQEKKRVLVSSVSDISILEEVQNALGLK